MQIFAWESLKFKALTKKKKDKPKFTKNDIMKKFSSVLLFYLY